MIEKDSLDVVTEKVAQLRELFPEVLAEGKIDFKRLRDVLGDDVAFANEHYELSWAGKAEARAEIQKTTSATLVPDGVPKHVLEAGNIFIEGENLEVLHVLQRSYFGKIKMIYIDPPYNTGNDSFVYPDDYSERQDDYKKRAGITNEHGFLNKQDLWKKNTKESGQFHSVWLSMMYPRLYLARNLLREDGVIFISIDDNEQANLKLLCDEIFGAENFLATFVWQSKDTPGNDSLAIAETHNYLIAYTKSGNFRPNLLVRNDKQISNYKNPDNDPRGPWLATPLTRSEYRERDYYPLKNLAGQDVLPPSGTCWRRPKHILNNLISENRIWWGKSGASNFPMEKKFLSEAKDGVVNQTWWPYEFAGSTRNANSEIKELFEGSRPFDTPKPTRLIQRVMQIATDKDSVILDFFAGSGTTAHAVLDLNEQDGGNRQFICVQLPETLEETSEAYKAGYRTIADICKARISKVIAKLQAERETASQNADLFADTTPKQALGFNCFKIAPSNFKQWRSDIDNQAILEQLDMFRHSEKPDSDNHNMLVELLLKSGRPLTAKVETVTIDGQTLYNVESGGLLIFFDSYNPQVNAFIFELKPQRVVCLDRVFNGNDEALTNFKLNLKDAGIDLQII